MIYLALGSNEGNRLFYLRKALLLLKEIAEFNVCKESIILETPALVKLNAPKSWKKPFLNMVVQGTTTLSPLDLLQKLQQIEYRLGRPSPHETWSPRTIDLDILLWDEQIIHTPCLKVPHPALLDRFFWIHLLATLSPTLHLPNQPTKTLETLAHSMQPNQPCFTRSMVLNPQLVGVVNITPDSFSDGGTYLEAELAIQQILKLHQEGATIIEIGAQSTRPGAVIISPEEEYQRLAPILEKINPYLQTREILLSLDSFNPSTILKILDQHPIAWVNLQRLPSLEDLSHIATYPCQIVSMHALTIPTEPESIIKNLSEIEGWTQNIIKQLNSVGFSKERIILDPGIGFGKSMYQNLQLLQNIQSLQAFHRPILVGHSRKSYMKAFSCQKPQERDIETLAISDHLYNAGVDYLRVHDIAAHHRFWTAKKLMKPLT